MLIRDPILKGVIFSGYESPYEGGLAPIHPHTTRVTQEEQAVPDEAERADEEEQRDQVQDGTGRRYAANKGEMD